MIYAERQPNRESGNIKDAGAVTARHMPDMTCGLRIEISPHTRTPDLKPRRSSLAPMPLLGVDAYDAIGCILNLDIAVENSSSKYYLKKEGVLYTLLREAVIYVLAEFVR